MGAGVLENATYEKAGKVTCGPARSDATDPSLDFVSNVHHLMHFLATPFALANKLDRTLEILFDDPSEESDLINYSEAIRGDAVLAGEIQVIHCVDHFLTYISHLLALLFRQKPEILSHAQINLADVIRLPDKDAVIRYAVDEYVRRVSYQGMIGLYRDVKNKVGFQLFTEEQDLNFAVECVAVRNILVHNSGIVDSAMVAECPKYRSMEGGRVTGYAPQRMSDFIVLAAEDIDARAKAKWGLPAGRGRSPHLCHRLGKIPPQANS